MEKWEFSEGAHIDFGHEFNGYTLQAEETFDFGEFRNAEEFLRTAEPIEATIKELKKMLNLISSNSEGSMIIFLTARSDFDDKEKFLNIFRKYGIDIDSSRMYVERSGNIQGGSVAEKKKEVVLGYLETGVYRRVRLIDDNEENLGVFLSIKQGLSAELLDLIRKKHHLKPTDDPIAFFAYHVKEHEDMKLYGRDNPRRNKPMTDGRSTGANRYKIAR